MNKKIYFFGGWNVAQYFDNVIVFDTETETWAEAGAMKVPRGRPGASVVKLDDVKEYATDCVTKDISNCEPGFKPWRGKCYMNVEFTQTWQGANELCISASSGRATLTSIHSQEENEHVYSLFSYKAGLNA